MPAKRSENFVYQCPTCGHLYPWRSPMEYPPCHEHIVNGKRKCIEYALIKEPTE